MKTSIVKDSLGWGFILWLIGYLLGIVLFFVVPPTLIGWVIMPIGVSMTLWVAIKKVKGDEVLYYALIGLAWLLIAVVFDYQFLVKVFHPADGYYKLDVYFYYSCTFLIPLLVGWYKGRATTEH